MRLLRKIWVSKATAFPRRLVVGAKSQVKKRYQQLKNRYGPRYTRAMLFITFLGFFSPIPGLTVAVIAVVVVIAEIHRIVSRTQMNRKAAKEELAIMSIKCDFIVNDSATPDQLTAIGSALWRWCNRKTRNPGIYQHLDSQILSDLIAGKLPASGQTPEQFEQRADGVHFAMSDNESNDGQAAIDRLRREIPDGGIVDIKVAGVSWSIARASEMSCALS